MSDERPRKSWREIDRGRDRSKHRQEDRSRGEGPRRGPRSEKSYRAALDRLFDSGKIADIVDPKTGGRSGEDGEQGESRIKLQARIRAAGDRDELTAAVDAYLAHSDALPDDLELLGRVLEHRDPARQLDAMERISDLLDTGARPKRTRAMVGQLKMLRDVGDDPEIVAAARALIERLD